VPSPSHASRSGTKTTKVRIPCALLLETNLTSLLSFPPDPIFISLLSDILTELASSSGEGIYETVVKQALPILVSAIGSATADESWITSAAIEFTEALVKGASAEKGMGEGFFALLAPALFECLDKAEDRDVLQVCPSFVFPHIGC